MRSFSMLSTIVVAMLIAGCLAPDSIKDATHRRDLLTACREKWGWYDIETAFGYPTATLTQLKAPSFLELRPEVKIFRVTMVNPNIHYGAPTITSACIVREKDFTFFKDELDATSFLSQTKSVHNVEDVVGLVSFFGDLCGYVLHLGVPGKERPVLASGPDVYFKLHNFINGQLSLEKVDPTSSPDSDRIFDPRSWTLEVARDSGGGWEILCTFVSLDSRVCYRYRVTISNEGRMSAERLHEIYVPAIYV